MQETNFEFEILLHDDASVDGTGRIIQEYAERFPKKIFPIIQKENQGRLGINAWLLYQFPRARGKYIALCDGDDYWTDPLKLQKQVDFLEANEEFVACYHSIMVIDSEGKLLKKKKNTFLHNHDLSSDELMKGRVMSAVSLCFRNVIKEYPEEYYKSPTGDNFLCSLLGNYGKGKYLSDIKPSAYRVHSGGIWSLRSDTEKKMTLLLSYFWLWQYYARIGKLEYALSYYRRIILEGFYSNPFKGVVPDYLGNSELFIVKTVRRFFRLLRSILVSQSVNKN